MTFDRTGGPEVLALHQVDLLPPGPGELLLKVEAIGLNRAEVMFRQGTYFYEPALPSGLGYEAAGTVLETGPGVTGFSHGDPVSVLPAFSQNDYGTYGDHILVPSAATVHRPASRTPVDAAASWMAHLTAYGALVEDGRTRPGDHLLLTAASSSVGLAAIQTARRLGAVPIATTRTAAKRRRLLDAGAAHVVVTDDEDLPEQVAEITGGKGAHTVFDPVAGPGVDILARCVAPGGRLIVYGALDPRPTPLPNAQRFPALSTRTYAVFEVTTDPHRLANAVAYVDSGLETGVFHPVVDATFDLTDIVEAHRHLESGTHVGKIVVTVRH
ncbi:zinc-dependent alcohol dehydrogenase family protein [Streptomyces sp. NPDC000963]